MSRYNSRRKAINNSEEWENTLDERGVKKIEQFVTPRFANPTEDELRRIKTKDYTWKQGDRFWRIAALEFGDARLWWLIARVNNKPSEHLLENGDIIKIPTNYTVALEVLGD
jgi:nucleoid-associated protein YgaU